ncbi:tigger transposable element-derived protein 1-like [Erythrolamprus reginae]|uniref:tigger transposable element-derived protein 1-like n=1 Tax=Erythrolamprus reginae TaxID=121349 RepID=UPI00396CBCB9
MPPKRCTRSGGGDAKKTRRILTIKEKIDILDMLKGGRSYADVGRQYGINESSVRTIRDDEKKIRQSSLMAFNKAAKRMVTPRNKRLMKMEAALSLWVQDCRKKSIALDTNTIRTKAQQLYNRLEDTEGGDADEGNAAPATFTASKGWFEKFQRRYGLKSVSLHGEAASADTGAAENFVQRTFKDLIAEGGYLPEQVFNMDETGLFWKRMPSRTFLMQEEVNGLLDEHGLPLTDKDLEELTRSASEEEEEAEAEQAEEEEDVGLTLERLAELNRATSNVQRMVELWDPNMTRSIQFNASLDNIFAPYRSMLAQKKKRRQQLPMTMFVTKTKRSVTPSPAASIVEMVIEEDP